MSKIREEFPEVVDTVTREALEESARMANAKEEQYVNVEFPQADVEVEVPVSFGSTPDDATPQLPPSNAQFYRGGSSWTKKKIYLKSTVAGILVRFRVYREE